VRRVALFVEGDHERNLLLSLLLASGWTDARSSSAKVPPDLPSFQGCGWARRDRDECVIITVFGHGNFGSKATRTQLEQFLHSGAHGGVGFVLDADAYGSVSAVVDSVRSATHDLRLPAIPGAGEVSRSDDGRPVGVWVSPDNVTDDGCLDDLLVLALADNQPELFHTAGAFVDGARAALRNPRRSSHQKLRAHVALTPFNPGASLATVLLSHGSEAFRGSTLRFAPLLRFVDQLLGG
jgi:hypothetical protein